MFLDSRLGGSNSEMITHYSLEYYYTKPRKITGKMPRSPVSMGLPRFRLNDIIRYEFFIQNTEIFFIFCAYPW